MGGGFGPVLGRGIAAVFERTGGAPVAFEPEDGDPPVAFATVTLIAGGAGGVFDVPTVFEVDGTIFECEGTAVMLLWPW